MARPVTQNRDVIQSYVLTTAKYDFSVYEKRILYRLVEMAQDELRGIMIRDNMHKIVPTLWNDRKITMPVADILSGENDKNYAIAKKAFESLATKGITYEDDHEWRFTNIIAFPHIEKGAGTATFTVEKSIWQCCLDFTKGYNKYELKIAMSFKSVYSMRMYELMSGQKSPLTFKVEDLRERFKLTDKYKLQTDFKKRVLDIAKKELDACSPYSFSYEEVKAGRKVVAYKFTPIYQDQFRDHELEKRKLTARTSASFILADQIYDYMHYQMGFTAKEINSHKNLLDAAQNTLPDMLGFLADLKARSRKATNPKGWIINAIKHEVSNKSSTDELHREAGQCFHRLEET